MVILGRYSEYVYAIFRIVFGFLLLIHGTQKFFDLPPAKQPMGSTHRNAACRGDH